MFVQCEPNLLTTKNIVVLEELQLQLQLMATLMEWSIRVALMLITGDLQVDLTKTKSKIT